MSDKRQWRDFIHNRIFSVTRPYPPPLCSLWNVTGKPIDSSLLNNVFIAVVFPGQLRLLNCVTTIARWRKQIFQVNILTHDGWKRDTIFSIMDRAAWMIRVVPVGTSLPRHGAQRTEWFAQWKVICRGPCAGLMETKWSQDSDTVKVTWTRYRWSVVPLASPGTDML